MKLTIGSGKIFTLLIISFLFVGAQNIDSNSSMNLSSKELSQKALNAFRNYNLLESKRLFKKAKETLKRALIFTRRIERNTHSR